MSNQPPIYGLLAEFSDAQALVDAANRTREEGYQRIDAYSPYPIHELDEALGIKKTILPWLVLLGGLIGGIGIYALMYYSAVISYPFNVGGRPLHSWPSFIPITFEMIVLCAALTAVFGMLALNGLPMPYHPLFNVESFALASRDKYFLLISARDPKFDADKTREFLQSLQPQEVNDVPH